MAPDRINNFKNAELTPTQLPVGRNPVPARGFRPTHELQEEWDDNNERLLKDLEKEWANQNNASKTSSDMQ